MIKDLLRLIALSTSICLGLGILWAGLFGLSQSRLKHPTKQERLVELCSKAPFSIGHSPGDIKGIRIRWEKNQWLQEKNSTPLNSNSEVAKEFLEKPLFVSILGKPAASSLSQLKKIFSKYDTKENLVFLSDSDSALNEMRDIAPRWSYGTGQTFLSRFLIFSSFNLLGLLTVPGDILQIQDIRAITKTEALSILAFAKARNKIVIFGDKNKSFTKMGNSAAF